jgi:hypothetical protein
MKYAIALILLCSMLACASIATQARVEKVGTIVKLHHGGIFCSTYDAELIRGGMNGGSGSFGVTPFDFTIENSSTADSVQRYLEQAPEVRITYRREGIYAACRSGAGGGDFLTSIAPAR